MNESRKVASWSYIHRKHIVSTPAHPRQKLNIFQLSVDSRRGGSAHASGTLPGVKTSSYYRRLNFCGRVVSQKIVSLGKSRNRCERPLRAMRFDGIINS